MVIIALTDKSFWMAGWRTLVFAFWAVLIETFLGVALALFIGNRDFLGRNVVKTGFLMPLVATPVAVALTWKLLYDNNFGIINHLLRKIGLSYPAVSSVDTVLSAYIIIDIWQWTPFVMLMVIAGLSTLPAECYEAAMIDGASRFQILRRVTLPLLSPTIMMTLALRIVDALKVFEDTMAEIWAAYGKLESMGIPAEDARYLLPNGCTTNITITMNARELLHFFSLRCCNRAQWEIREMADKMLELCREVSPVIFRDAGPPCVRGPCPEGKLSCGKPRRP